MEGTAPAALSTPILPIIVVLIIKSPFRRAAASTGLPEQVICGWIAEQRLRVHIVHTKPQESIPVVLQFVSVLLSQSACLLLLTLVVDEAGMTADMIDVGWDKVLGST